MRYTSHRKSYLIITFLTEQQVKYKVHELENQSDKFNPNPVIIPKDFCLSL